MRITEQGERLRRDITWNLVPLVLLAGVGLGLSFAISAIWGAGAFGVFDLVRIVFFVFAVIGACGLQFAVLRAVAEAPDDRERVAAVVVGALVPTLGLAVVVTAAFVVLRGPVATLLAKPAVADGMLWAAPGLFCFTLNKVLLCVVNGLRRMRAYAVYTSLRYVLIALGVALAALVDLAADHLAAIWTFSEGVLLVVLLVELVATVDLARGRGWVPWTRRHLDYGARGVIATLGYEINSKLDVWMLGTFADSRVVGIYALAASLNEGAMQLAVVVQNNLNPLVARDLAAGERGAVEALVRRTRRWFVPALIGACALGAVLYPVLIPWVLRDPGYALAAVPFAILMAGVALASPWLPFNQILLMASRPGWHTLLVIAVSAINFAGTLVLIPRFGLVGAALAPSIALLAQMALVAALARIQAGVRL